METDVCAGVIIQRKVLDARSTRSSLFARYILGDVKGVFMFENKYTHNLNVHYSRYIASWIKAHGGRYERKLFEGFKHWLKNECELTDEEIHDIWEMATNGKMELQDNAKLYLEKYRSEK